MKKVLKFPELNYKVKIKHDDSIQDSPRDWDNLGTCIFFHNRYNIGDSHDYNHDDYENWDALEKQLIKDGAVVILPVYMCDHSGQTINTAGFSCSWDSRQIGFIVAFREDIIKEYSVKRVSKKLKEMVTSILESEVEVYDQYITGDVYFFEAENTETEESDYCGGFYGDTVDNGIFDNLDIKGLTFERYTEVYNNAIWE